MARGPILVIDDDLEDQALLTAAIESQKFRNAIKTFDDGTEALEWLRNTPETPFLIFCDIKMPRMNGIELRENITRDQELARKSIPFVFVTGSADARDVEHAYRLCVQGFFTKPNTVAEWEGLVKMIIGYWAGCIHPNSNPPLV